MKQDQDDIRALVPRMPNATCPIAGIAAGGQPALSDLEALAHAGYRTVVDLRAPGEPRGYDEPAAVRRIGMDYVNLPVGPGPITARELDLYRAIANDPERWPLLVHCASGNRVGPFVIAQLVLDAGMTPRQAIEIAVGGGLRSPQLAQIALDYVARHGVDVSGDGEAV